MQTESIEEKEPFRIQDDGALNWVFREHINPQYAEIKRIEEFAAAENERITQWKEQQLKSPKSELEYWEGLVQHYHHQQLLQDEKRKTISTPYGKSKSRRSKATPEQVDKEATLKYVKDNQMTDFIKEEVKWGDFKKSLFVRESNGVQVAVDENGQVVDGVIVKPESISFSIEPVE